jgi:hypothetical protein
MAATSAGDAPQAYEDHSSRNRQQSSCPFCALGPGLNYDVFPLILIHTSNLKFLVMQNLKRQQLDEERYSSIERANYLLLERMSHIMTHPQTVDMKQSLPPPKSLNKDGRKKELMRITEENHNILRRIQVETLDALFPYAAQALCSLSALTLASSAQRAILLSARMD